MITVPDIPQLHNFLNKCIPTDTLPGTAKGVEILESHLQCDVFSVTILWVAHESCNGCRDICRFALDLEYS